MGRWSRLKRRVFKVKVYYMKHGTARITLPQPLADILDKPEYIVYEIDKDDRIIIYPK